MGKFQPYAAYRDSGIEWAPKCPNGWDVIPTFAACMENRKANSAGTIDNVLSLSYGQIIRRDVEANFGLLPESFNTYQIVQPGHIVMRLTDLQNDKRSLRVGFVKEEGIITSAYLGLKFKKRFDTKYAYYLLHSYDLYKVYYGMGGGLRQTMKFSDIKWLPLFCPPRLEQESIAAFLDHETAKIDRLTARQERLIELLKEKRQALISHAVTKGLTNSPGANLNAEGGPKGEGRDSPSSPDAPMKDSGVEWLGEVPAHWQVRSLKYSIIPGSSISYGIVQPGDRIDDGVPFVQTTNISGGNFDLNTLQRTTPEIAAAYPRSRLQGGEVILGIRASIGAAYVVPDFLEGVNLSRGIARIRPFTDLLSQFLVWYFRSHQVAEYWLSSKQGSTFSEVSIETVKEIHLPVPPVHEQAYICTALDKQLKKLDRLEDQAKQGIGLMQEHRTALISAAVTGKIDVRGWQKPNTEPEETAAAASA